MRKSKWQHEILKRNVPTTCYNWYHDISNVSEEIKITFHSECIQNQAKNVFFEAKFRPFLRTTTSNFLFSRRAATRAQWCHFWCSFQFPVLFRLIQCHNMIGWVGCCQACCPNFTVQSTIPSCSGACASREYSTQSQKKFYEYSSGMRFFWPAEKGYRNN